MATIQLERGPDGRFIRLERFRLPGNNESIFTRRYVVTSGKEYELIGNFMCEYFFELRHRDEQTLYACAASDDGEGRVEVITPMFLAPCGKTVTCQHICQHKKNIAKWFLDHDLLPRLEKHRLDVFINHTDNTIELNPEVLNRDR